LTPIKHNLIALGSAAVVAVYSAGYVRTRSAAERFAVEDAERRPERRPAPNPAVADSVRPSPETLPVAKSGPSEARAAPTHVAPARNDTRAFKSAATSRAAEAATPPPARDSTSNPTVDTVPVKVVQTTPADTAAASDNENAPLKDGTYSGWGTSRHGDIQATVAIKNGKISEAFISECLTQYSCSWIAALPPQVVARQSAEVDYVSGATQSTNAFYYAVIAALKKAK
jgi:uncharacterized protein with FMN-binding domain